MRRAPRGRTPEERCRSRGRLFRSCKLVNGRAATRPLKCCRMIHEPLLGTRSGNDPPGWADGTLPTRRMLGGTRSPPDPNDPAPPGVAPTAGRLDRAQLRDGSRPTYRVESDSDPSSDSERQRLQISWQPPDRRRRPAATEVPPRRLDGHPTDAWELEAQWTHRLPTIVEARTILALAAGHRLIGGRHSSRCLDGEHPLRGPARPRRRRSCARLTSFEEVGLDIRRWWTHQGSVSAKLDDSSRRRDRSCRSHSAHPPRGPSSP